MRWKYIRGMGIALCSESKLPLSLLEARCFNEKPGHVVHRMLAASLVRNRITSASSCRSTHLAKSAFGMLARLAVCR